MYLEHFGITEHPFGLTPNTQFYCNLKAYEDAFEVLLFGLKSNEGFIKVIGEVGTGKTLLCRKLLNELKPPFVTAYIPSPDITPTALRKAFAKELQLDVQGLDDADLREKLTEKLLEHHAKDEQVVLIIDEAQALPDDTLETMRLLTNLETESDRLLQIVLFGQPELDERLAQRKFRQLRQRVTFSYTLNTLAAEDIKSYIYHRLAIAGYRSGNLFKKSALDLVVKHCKGTPRLINILCSKAMFVAYGKGEREVNKRAIKAALIDSSTNSHLTYDSLPSTSDNANGAKSFLLQVSIVSLAVAIVVYVAYLHYTGLI